MDPHQGKNEYVVCVGKINKLDIEMNEGQNELRVEQMTTDPPYPSRDLNAQTCREHW